MQEKQKQRNYSKERAKEVETLSTIGVRLSKTLAEDFTAKIELEGVTKSAKIKELIEGYTYGENLKKSDT